MASVTKHECCGFKIQLWESGVTVEFQNGDVKNYKNLRNGIIVFSESVAGFIENSLLSIIEKYGCNRYTGEKEVKK